MSNRDEEMSEGWEIFWGVVVILVLLGLAATSELRPRLNARHFNGTEWFIRCEYPPRLTSIEKSSGHEIALSWEQMTSAQRADAHKYCTEHADDD